MKILVVDDHALIRTALRGVLDQLDANVVVLEASDSRSAFDPIASHPDLDLVLLDLNLPDAHGLSALEALRTRYPALPVVVLSSVNDRTSVVHALDAGAMGYIPKDSPNEVLVSALRLVLAGGIYIPPEILARSARQPPTELGALALLAAACASYLDQASTHDAAEKMVSENFTAPMPALLKRLVQDRSQQICSKIGDAKLTQEEAAEVVALARSSMQYPQSGKLVGDRKVGDAIAHDGAGDRIQYGVLEKRKENGGLCQNCHALAPGEINVGNIGPSLTGYGAQRGGSDAIAKLTYERIYNGWLYAPCSNMPRLGANGHLSPEQITHLVAYLIDPRSPINRK